jgi:hypothetical protein
MGKLVRIFWLIAICLLPAPASSHHPVRRPAPVRRPSAAKKKVHSHWDPGHTYTNPLGLPPWLRTPRP